MLIYLKKCSKNPLNIALVLPFSTPFHHMQSQHHKQEHTEVYDSLGKLQGMFSTQQDQGVSQASIPASTRRPNQAYTDG